jgi:hypothetical protein
MATVPRDLRAPEQDPWSDIAVPRGWALIRSVVQAVADHLPAVTDHATRCILDEVEDYGGIVPVEDLRNSVQRNFEVVLLGVAEKRGPTSDELHVRRALGRRRAEQGLPPDALLQAFQVGYRELWEELVREATSRKNPALSEQLLQGATIMWSWIQTVTNAVADEYHRAARRQEAQIVGTRQRLLEVLVTGDPSTREAADLARAAGLDPRGTAVGAVTAWSHGPVTEELGDIVRDPAVVAVPRAGFLVAVSTQLDAKALGAWMGGATPQQPVGIGLARSGLVGARQSLEDARLALMAADRDDPVAFFDHVWLRALLAMAAERLSPLVAAGADIAAGHPDLAETVVRYTLSGGSVSGTSAAMHLHPNSVGYRLDRWRELTGWEPREFLGQLHSLAAIWRPDA